ncbi:DNA methyltransferase [Sinorhizobium meliloti]|uniref:DNA methyltransferase n=1 Tax=Rhizobium meliloti TaxID=382 RepID=UPI0002F58A69|nr:DNA methyltransferase [Sinorhizobium meliloti]MDE4595283.1 DNA methylase N-4 [Sinorhizobium meliloti]
MRSSSTGCAGSGQGNETAAYGDFLRNKIRLAPVSGLQVNADEVNPILKDHQRDIVVWAVRGGKRAVFAAFGLGKSVIQIEVLRLICEKTSGRGLIVLPLGVRQEFRRDGEMLGVDIKFIRRIEEAGETGLYMTNYETVRDGKLDPNEFTAVSLDEASVLRSYGSKTYQTFLSLFEGVRYRFVATATPSPNRYKELIHYAGFLGIMDTGQALTRFFQRDSTQANNLTLYPHKEREFWLWLNSWAIFLQRPSDLGYSDEGYSLPPFDVVYHEVQSNIADGGVDRDGQSALFRDTAVGVVSASKEKRETLDARIAKMGEILAGAPNDHFIIWHDLEDERRAIERAVPTAVSVYGTQELDEREQAIIDFSNGEFQYLAAKPVIAGSGCNFQRHCHKAIFLGIGFKFNDFIQALHRIYRFLQTRQVEIHIIYAESEREVLRTLQGKWEAHNRMVENMSEIIREHGLDKLSAAEVLTRSIGVERIEAKGEGWLVANNDCVDETRSMPDNSVDLIVTSIPFSNHYEYTPSYNDFGHTDSDDHFFQQMDFLTPELLRVLKPGRLYTCHVKDRILFGNVTGMGMPTVNPFHARTIFHTMSHGFAYMGMIQVNTDVVRENNQTYRLGWTENCKDGTKTGVGSPEYILLFRKLPSDRSKAYADERVVKDKEDYTRARWQVDAHSFWRSSGDRLLTPEELASLGPDLLAKTFTEWSLKNVYDYEVHIKIGEALEARGALPSTFMSLAPGATSIWTWHDVNRMRTLNGEQTKKGLENHICPLQFDIVDRLIKRFSNEGELVFDPFGGLFTVPYRALKLGRRGRASELNPGYFLDGIKYLQAMEREISTPTMFDIFERTEVAA